MINIAQEKEYMHIQETQRIFPIRIYLDFTQSGSIITIHQTSKLLSGEVFLQRERRVRKPYDKHMRIGLGGVIATSMGRHKKLYKNTVTHIGIYLSHPIALEVLKNHILYISDKRDVKIFIFEKEAEYIQYKQG